MMLSDGDIAAAVHDGRLKLDPFDPQLIQPASIDVLLDRRFRVFSNHADTHIDPCVDDPTRTEQVEVDKLVLHPGEFVLASTVEFIELGDDLAGRLEGKSSLGRCGLVVHSTAGFIDPGFRGNVTLELANVNRLPIVLTAGMKIGQLCLFSTLSPAQRPYGQRGNHYQDQRGPVAARGTAAGRPPVAGRVDAGHIAALPALIRPSRPAAFGDH
ncbi:MAG: dCTP deaminase [Mycobacterium sp.]